MPIIIEEDLDKEVKHATYDIVFNIKRLIKILTELEEEVEKNGIYHGDDFWKIWENTYRGDKSDTTIPEIVERILTNRAIGMKLLAMSKNSKKIQEEVKK